VSFRSQKPVTFQADRSALWNLDMLLAHRKGV